MPELPEVETVARYINRRVRGKVFASVATPNNYRRALNKISSRRLSKILRGQKIKCVSRRAKYVVIELERGVLCVHLRMTGQLLTGQIGSAEKKYITACFKFRDGSQLLFHDVRKFGRIYYYEDLAHLDRKLGIEPLSTNFSPQVCHALLTARARQLKPLLLDQRVIAGIGNIYADEILWACKLNPSSPSNRLTKKDCKAICQATRRILNRSIKLNGTTFKSFYFGAGNSGEFASNLKVFDRTGEPCPRCRTAIIKLRVAQRGTHICPKCQK